LALILAPAIAEVETDRDRPDDEVEPRATFPTAVLRPTLEAVLPPVTAVVEMDEMRLIELVLTTDDD
jgi:hypothetical protein